MDENMENNVQNQGNQSNNGLAIAGFVVGLVSIFLNFYCITGIVGLILSIVGLKKSKETEKGKVSNITLAVQRPFKNANGEYETDFFPVAIWNGIAETTSQYCRKGDLIGVKGRLQSKDNVISIIAERITFLSSKSIKDDISTEKELKI